MATCVYCKEPLKCGCVEERPLSHVSVPCEKRKGQLWVHATDDAGVDLSKIPIRISPGDNASTNGEGFVKRDNLEPGSVTVTVTALPDTVSATYCPPDPRSKSVNIADGTIAYVPFLFKRLASLKVKIFCTIDPDPRALIQRVVVHVASDQGGLAADTVDGVADFGKVMPGKHTITISFVDPAQNHYDLLPRVSDTIELLPGENGELEFDVEPLYKKVRFIGHCLLTIPKAKYEKGAWKASYNGPVTDAEDVQKRIDFARANIAAAKSLIVDRADELKIFMVPECFFLGKYGGYEVATLATVIAKLQELVGGAEWKHWLFVFGTVNGLYTWPKWEDLKGPGVVYEMFNNSPVLRGGWEYKGGAAPSYTRLMQKSEFSAELLSDEELEAEPDAERVQLTTEKVRGTFGETENEGVLARHLKDLLSDPEPTIGGKSIATLFTEGGSTPGDWASMKALLRKQQTEKGAVTMVREVRACRLATNLPISDLGGYCNEVEASVPPEDVAWKLLLISLAPVKQAFVKSRPAGDLLGIVNRALAKCNAPDTASPDIGNLALVSGGAKTLLDKIAVDLANSEKASFMEIWERIPKGQYNPVWTFSPVGVTKKLLDMLLEERGVGKRDVLIKAREKSNLAFSDYTFAFDRKPGPLEDLPGAANNRKVLIGLEICADHSTAALVNSSGNKVPLDLQLVPSAGMSISLASAAHTKATGYIFNCDGWNKNSVLHGGRVVAEVPCNEPTYPVAPGKNPLSPHSELLTKAGASVVAVTYPAAGDLSILPDNNGKLFEHMKIFANGIGKIHVYPVQPLPDVVP